MPLIFIAILGAYQVLLIIVHIALYKTLEFAFGWHGPWLIAILAVLSVSFVLASIVSHSHKSKFLRWYYAVSAYWFGLVHFLFVGVLLFFVAANIFYRTNHYISPAIIASISLGIFFLIHLYGTWNASRAEITRIRVTLPNLPEAWRGKKIVFVSDPHLGNIWQAGFAEKIVRKINALGPEAVFIGGDVFDGVKCDDTVLVEPFRALSAPRGVYFVTGNHEYIEKGHPFQKAIQGVGIRILDDEVIDLRGIQLVGVDYKTTAHREDFEKVLGGITIDRERPSILLKHEPSNLDVAEQAGISLQFSGHTHRGQIFPLNFITSSVYKGYDYGLKPLGMMSVYTSSGVGTWGAPVRTGSKSEIVLVTLV